MGGQEGGSDSFWWFFQRVSGETGTWSFLILRFALCVFWMLEYFVQSDFVSFDLINR